MRRRLYQFIESLRNTFYIFFNVHSFVCAFGVQLKSIRGNEHEAESRTPDECERERGAHGDSRHPMPSPNGHTVQQHTIQPCRRRPLLYRYRVCCIVCTLCTVHSDSCAMWCDAIAAARHHRTHGIMAYSHEQSLSFVLHPHSFTNLLSSCKVREPYAPSLGIESQYFPPKHTMPSHPTVLWAHNQFVTNASPI